MKVTLIGFMGCGKSTVGELLSKKLNLPFIDLDSLIVERTGREIPQIFKELGEEGFREIERELLREVLKREGSLVLSVGGGAPAYRDNIEVINKHSTSIFLNTPFESLWERIFKDKNRPLVKLGREGLKELYLKRLPYYKRANLEVECRDKSPEEIAEEIILKLS